MLASYIDKAMESAIYKIIEEDGTYRGEIPELRGVWANQPTLDDCRQQLQKSLSDWLTLHLTLGLTIPVIADINPNLR